MQEKKITKLPSVRGWGEPLNQQAYNPGHQTRMPILGTLLFESLDLKFPNLLFCV